MSPSSNTRPDGAHRAAHSGVLVSRSVRMRAMYACCAFSATPSRASRAAGATSTSSGIEPHRRTASHTPAGAPYTPQEAGPM
jgi:hypothetical protein